MAGRHGAHGEPVEASAGERAAGVDGAESRAQRTQCEWAERIGLQHAELRAVGRDAGLGEGGQAGHDVVGAHAQRQRQQLVLQRGGAARAAVQRAAPEARPAGGTEAPTWLPSRAVRRQKPDLTPSLHCLPLRRPKCLLYKRHCHPVLEISKLRPKGARDEPFAIGAGPPSAFPSPRPEPQSELPALDLQRAVGGQGGSETLLSPAEAPHSHHKAVPRASHTAQDIFLTLQVQLLPAKVPMSLRL